MTHHEQTAPTPPTNVRIERSGGEVVPLELTYAGVNTDGLHEWVATIVVAFDPGTDSIKISRLPPRTTVCIDVRHR